MSDTPNLNQINFEKTLPASLLQIKSGNVYIWPLIRLSMLDLALQANKKPPVDPAKLHPSEKIHRKILTMAISLFKFFIFVISNRNIEALFRMNSFSLRKTTSGQFEFKNQSSHEIRRSRHPGKKSVVIVNNLPGYEIDLKNDEEFIFFPSSLISVFSKLYSKIQHGSLILISKAIASPLKQNPELVKLSVSYQVASIYAWRLIYKILKPKVIYFECPQRCFESEIVAAKLEKIRTIEIFHGIITLNEVAYQHKHLNLENGITGYCHTYLAPSTNQIAYLERTSTFDTIEYTPYIINENLRQEYNKLLSDFFSTQNPLPKKRLLIMTSICDFAIAKISEWLDGKNVQVYYEECCVRLHPEDTVMRWQPLINKYPFLSISKKSFLEDMMPDNYIVAVSSTVVLQLRELKVEFIDLSDTV